MTKLDEEATRTEVMRISEIDEVVVKATELESSGETVEEVEEVKVEEVKVEQPVKQEKLNLKATDKKKKPAQSQGSKGKTSKTVRVDIKPIR